MARRALLIGSQTLGLSGVSGDVQVMGDSLRSLGFDVHTITAGEATGVWIQRAYRELIDSCSSEDAALVYYSGHGGRWRNRRHDLGSDLPEWLQFIVPTDFGEPHSGFPGILAQELSFLQHELTERTQNVTSIFDCCHSARMFRGIDAVPRAVIERELPWDDVLHRWNIVRDFGNFAREDANPHAVQLVACAPDQSAYELPNSALGATHGALTAAFVEVLRRPEAPRLSWREVIEVVRPRVLDVVPSQRPDLLGPNADRVLFTLARKDARGALPVTQAHDAVWLEGVELFGIAEANTYVLRAPGVPQPLADAIVAAIIGDRARLSITPPLVGKLPAGVLAYPVEVSLGRRPVVVSPLEHPDRDFVVNSLRRSQMVQVARPGTTEAMATLALDEEGLLLFDSAGEPLTSRHRPVSEAGMRLVEQSLNTLARATWVRQLDSGHGLSSLPEDVTIACSRIDRETGEEVPVVMGEHLYVGDALVIRIQNRAAKRHVSVLDVGLTGGVTILTKAEPSGATIVNGEELIVGQDPAGAVRGIDLYWPDGLPATGPRPETLLTIVADRPVSGLWSLEQEGIRTRSSSQRPVGGLDGLIAELATGTRDLRPVAGSADQTRYLVSRLDFLLQPHPRPTGTGEPTFEIDERPDSSLRLLAPRSPEPAPKHVSLRLADLVVVSKRSLLRAKIRVDTLVVTAGSDGAEAVQARTFVVDRVQEGDRLPLDNVLLFDGPVRRFLDVAIWVSKADKKEVELAELLGSEMNGQEVAGALTTLAALAVASPDAAAIAGSVAAVASLVRVGARLLDAITGSSIGVYRTTLLPHERFGAGHPELRHPAQGSIGAQDIALAYEVVDATWGH